MIIISKSTNKELKEFGKKEWPIANREHYGQNVNYKEKIFVYKAVEGGKIVGSIKGKLEAGVLYINYLIVDHNRKDKGIGKSLTQKSEDFGRKFGAHKIHLITGKGWEAEKFYQALGYRQIAILPKHHFKKDFVVYEKFI